MNITHNTDIKSPELRAVLVEPILYECSHNQSFYNIASKIFIELGLSPFNLKKYLFYMIDYELISYNGKKQVFVLEDAGNELLNRIIDLKQKRVEDIKKIKITFECTKMIYWYRNILWGQAIKII